MQVLTARQRTTRIAATTILLGALLPVQAWFFNPASTLGVIARAAAVGAITGLIFGLIAIELLYRVNRRDPNGRLARAARTGLPLSAMGAMMTVVNSGLSSGGFIFASFIPIGLGVGLIAAGRASRVGDSRHCPKCDYEFAFERDEDAPIRCPECGTGWLGRLATGRKVRSTPLLASGIAVLAATALLAIAVVQGGALSRAMPTDALITWLGGAPSIGSGAAWTELAGRPLTADQRARLASRLLDRRLASRTTIGVEAKEWLDAEIAANTLPPDVRERFFAEMFRGELDAPRRVRVGEPFEVGFKHTDSNDGFAYKCFLYVGGFAIGDGPLLGRRTEGYYPNLIDRARPSQYSEALAATLTADRPGTATVRAEVWLVAQTGFPPRITWNDDGSAVLPPAAAWVKRLELTREIEVDP